MNKEEFLKRLEELLSDISEEERTDALAFYRSYFEDAGIGNEASILGELESPEKVAEAIKRDLGTGTSDRKATYNGGTYGSQNTSSQNDIEKLEKENKKNKTEKNILWIVLAVLTSPIWITVLLVLAAILFAVLACVLAVAVSIVVVMAALVICGFILAGVGIGYLFTKGVAVGLGLLGGGLLVLALGVLAVWLMVWCFGWFVPWAVKGIVKLCKKPFE